MTRERRVDLEKISRGEDEKKQPDNDRKPCKAAGAEIFEGGIEAVQILRIGDNERKPANRRQARERDDERRNLKTY